MRQRLRVTGAWRYQLKGGTCMGGGEAECSNARVWDSHSVNEFIVKVGFPFELKKMMMNWKLNPY